MRGLHDEEDHAKAHPGHAEVPEERRATEYLANERTFLAWIRTSIAVISVGFVITRVAAWVHQTSGPESDHRLFTTSLVMGIAMMGIGAILAILAVWRYQVVNRAIHEGMVKPDRGMVILVTVLVVCLALGMITFMLLTE